MVCKLQKIREKNIKATINSSLKLLKNMKKTYNSGRKFPLESIVKCIKYMKHYNTRLGNNVYTEYVNNITKSEQDNAFNECNSLNLRNLSKKRK